jgi:hypothetical protein
MLCISRCMMLHVSAFIYETIISTNYREKAVSGQYMKYIINAVKSHVYKEVYITWKSRYVKILHISDRNTSCAS